jgi:hypothetical protein
MCPSPSWLFSWLPPFLTTINYHQQEQHTTHKKSHNIFCPPTTHGKKQNAIKDRFKFI